MPKPHFTVGGTVQATGGVYIPRQADEELLKLCVEGAFAYVLTSRQVGKSSLMVRTAEQLASIGTRSVIIDLTNYGVQVSAEAWYLGLLTTIADDLGLETDVVKWWRDHSDFGATQRLTQFFEEIVLTEIPEPIVIFIDEIDSTLSLNFTDDFYAAIRYLYNARAKAPEFRRLTFVLIGVATPSDLISDPHRTPFNIGQQVNLTDFTFEEALPLAEGLCTSVERSQQVLQWIMKWTNGHPYLTQRLCRTIADERRSDWTEAEIAHAVAQAFFGRMCEEDNNLQFVRDMLTKRALEKDKLAVLEAYKEIRTSKRPVRDEEQSRIKAQLKLSGIVKREEGKLRVRNPIYHEVFGPAWIKEHWPVGWLQTVPLYAKIGSGVIVLLAIAAFVFAVYAIDFAKQNERMAQSERIARDSLQVLLNQQRELIFIADTSKISALASAQRAAEEAKRARLSAESEARAHQDALREGARAGRQAIVADSLRIEEGKSRRIAEHRSFELDTLRGRDLARLLVSQATLQTQQNNSELAALLARQAYLFNQKYGGALLPQIHPVLMKALNGAGGPIELREHTAAVRAAAFTQNGELFASAGEDKTVRLWRRANDYKTSEPLNGHTQSVRALAFTRDGRALFSGSNDYSLRNWNAQERQSNAIVLNNHTGRVWALALNADGQTLASGGADKVVFLWNANDPQAGPRVRLQSSAKVYALAFSADGQWLAAAGEDSVIHIWDMPSGKIAPVHTLKCEAAIKSLAYHPRQKLLVSGGADGKVAWWRMNSGSENPGQLKAMLAHETNTAVNALAFGNNGHWLATGGSDKHAKIWEGDGKSNEPLLTFNHEAFVWAIAFNPEASLLASAGEDKTIRLWLTNTDTLAQLVCQNVKRNLTIAEWREFIGSDIPYERTCPNLPADASAVNEAASPGRR